MNLGQIVEFTVLGIPQPQGSMKAFMPKKGKFPIVTSDNTKMKPWRQEISWAALRARGNDTPAGRNVAIRLEASFFFARPKSSKANDKTTKPDLSKLVRCLEDAMTGIIYEDDSQIVEIHCFKGFGQPRVEVRVSEALPFATATKPQPIKDSDLPFAP
jgi:Holliday junction resolvase RusA-like endonuclease